MSQATIYVFMAKASTTCAERCQFVTIVLLGLVDARASSLSATVVDARKTKKKRRRFEECVGCRQTPGEQVAAEARSSVVYFYTLVCKSRIFRFSFLNKCVFYRPVVAFFRAFH